MGSSNKGSLDRLDFGASGRSYRLAQPFRLWNMHNVFHVSMLSKYEPVPSHVLSVDDVDIDNRVDYVEVHIQILDSREHVHRNKVIPLVKVLLRQRGVEDATCESED